MKAKKIANFLTVSLIVFILFTTFIVLWSGQWVRLSESEKIEYAFEIRNENAIRFSDEGELMSSVKILFGLPKKENPLCFWVVRMTKADKTPEGEIIYKRRSFIGIGPFYYAVEENKQLEFKDEGEKIEVTKKSISM